MSSKELVIWRDVSIFLLCSVSPERLLWVVIRPFWELTHHVQPRADACRGIGLYPLRRITPVQYLLSWLRIARSILLGIAPEIWRLQL